MIKLAINLVDVGIAPMLQTQTSTAELNIATDKFCQCPVHHQDLCRQVVSTSGCSHHLVHNEDPGPERHSIFA